MSPRSTTDLRYFRTFVGNCMAFSFRQSEGDHIFSSIVGFWTVKHCLEWIILHVGVLVVSSSWCDWLIWQDGRRKIFPIWEISSANNHNHQWRDIPCGGLVSIS